MRTSGLGISIFLIAVGAILAWAVSVETEGINLNTVGLILFAVGAVGVIATLVLTATRTRTVVERDSEVIVERGDR